MKKKSREEHLQWRSVRLYERDGEVEVTKHVAI